MKYVWSNRAGSPTNVDRPDVTIDLLPGSQIPEIIEMDRAVRSFKDMNASNRLVMMEEHGRVFAHWLNEHAHAAWLVGLKDGLR